MNGNASFWLAIAAAVVSWIGWAINSKRANRENNRADENEDRAACEQETARYRADLLKRARRELRSQTQLAAEIDEELGQPHDLGREEA